MTTIGLSVQGVSLGVPRGPAFELSSGTIAIASIKDAGQSWLAVLELAARRS